MFGHPDDGSGSIPYEPEMRPESNKEKEREAEEWALKYLRPGDAFSKQGTGKENKIFERIFSILCLGVMIWLCLSWYDWKLLIVLILFIYTHNFDKHNKG